MRNLLKCLAAGAITLSVVATYAAPTQVNAGVRNAKVCKSGSGICTYSNRKKAYTFYPGAFGMNNYSGLTPKANCTVRCDKNNFMLTVTCAGKAENFYCGRGMSMRSPVSAWRKVSGGFYSCQLNDSGMSSSLWQICQMNGSVSPPPPINFTVTNNSSAAVSSQKPIAGIFWKKPTLPSISAKSTRSFSIQLKMGGTVQLAYGRNAKNYCLFTIPFHSPVRRFTMFESAWTGKSVGSTTCKKPSFSGGSIQLTVGG